MKKIFILFSIFLIGLSAKAYTQGEAISILQSRHIKPDKPASLMSAVIFGDIEQTKLLLDANLIDLNSRYTGMPFLVQAIYSKQNVIAILLLEHGANPKIKTVDGGNALFYAVKHGQTDVVRKILETPGINIKRQRQLLRLPLKTTAKKNGYNEIYDMLVKYEEQEALRK